MADRLYCRGDFANEKSKYAVGVAAHVSEPSAATVHGLTAPRLWATTSALVGLVGVVIGGFALAAPPIVSATIPGDSEPQWLC
jgi:hypothetical protein